jgi:hypothetical protein
MGYIQMMIIYICIPIAAQDVTAPTDLFQPVEDELLKLIHVFLPSWYSQ